MSRSLNMPTHQLIRRLASFNRNVVQVIVLTLLLTVVAAIPLWLGLPSFHSAASGAATPPPPPSPIVTIDVPDEVLVGEDFQFEVKFDNSAGAGVGYGPYIELYLPAKGADSNGPDSNNVNQKCDGISFLSASTSFANPPTVPLPWTYNSQLSTSASNLNCANTYTLPFAGMTLLPPAPAGDYQLVVIELPFGSFDESQPEIVVNVSAHLSDFADVSIPSMPSSPLTIYARGGFRYGDDELDNPPGLIQSAHTWDETAPTVFKLKKAYLGPENEAVSGPNFINYYPLRYQLTADIADQQEVKSLMITDNFPVNLQFAGNVQVKIKGNNAVTVATCPTNPGPYDVEISPLTSVSPGGMLTVKLCSPVTGSTATDEVAITFEFFIPESDANGKDILDKDCKNSPEQVKNDVLATGDWDPLDPRDPNPGDPAGTTVPIKSDLKNIDHVLQAKCIAIQKTVTQRLPDTGGPGLTPGDTLRYELNFQISDYRSMGKILITDLLSDGQVIVGTQTLTVLSDQFGSYSNISFNSTTFSSILDPNISCPDPGGIKGGTRLTFRVSSALAAAAGSGGPTRHQNGMLTGGHAAGAPSTIPAHGQIVFYARILDKFIFQYPPNHIKVFVDKDDPLNNCVSIEGLVYQNELHPTVPFTTLGNTTDDSGTQVTIAKDKPKKTVYAVKRGSSMICGPTTTPCLNLPGTPQDALPGDAVTFRIEYPIPSGDAEDLTLDDWLPLPVFDVGDPDAIPPIGLPTWPTAVPWCTGLAPFVPAPGRACRLVPVSQATPGHTLTKIPSLASGTANNLVFNYGKFNNPLNTSRKIDLLFTITITNKPFADGLFLTNEARENESNTFGPVPSQVTIAQINLREPKLRIRKGVIATDNPKGEYTLPGSPPTSLPLPTPANAVLSLAGISQISSSAPMVTSTDLAAGALNNDISNVDANDTVTFAVTVENQGGAPAYDVKVEDVIPHDINGNPTCFTIVPNTFQVKRGTGAVVNPFLYNLVFPTSTGGFEITSKPFFPIPINAYDPLNGKNIVIVTFQARLKANITPGCCDNKAEIKQYASQLNGPNFVSAGFTPPFEDTARVCVKPKAEKCVTATSEVHTQADNSVSGTPQPPQVSIGEIIRYHLTITLPEGVSPFFKVTDHLPPGLTYMPGTAKVALVSTLGISSSALGLSGAGMPDPGSNYTLGCLKPNPTANIPSGLVSPASFTPGDDPSFGLGILTNNDNDSDLEYVIIEFNALVNNISTNVDTVTLSNNYDIFTGKVVLGQPQVPIATSNYSDVVIVEPNFTMTKTVAPNPALKGQTLTYTVSYKNVGTADAFDVELKDTLPPGLTFGTITAGCPFTNVPSNTLTVTCAQIPKAPNPGSTVIVTYQAVANPVTCPVTLDNRANLTWTSLPGPNGTTVNQTGSNTPGNSGLADGERNGVTAPLTLNDYAATASAGVKIDCPCCATPPAGMVSWWPLNETVGATTVVDIMDGNNGSTRNNLAVLTPIGGGGGPNSILGQHVGNSLNFFTSYADVPNAANLNFGTGEFSIDAWVRVIPNSSGQTPTVQAIVDKTQQLPGVPRFAGYALFVHHATGSVTGRLGVLVDDGVSPPAVSAPLYHPALLSSGWHHLAVSVARPNTSSANVTLYVDGVASPSTTIAVGSTSSSANLWIGRSRLLPLMHANFREVVLDEIEIFSRAVTASEIQSIFKAGTTGKCTATITGVKFNDLNGNGVRDTGEPGLANWTITSKDQSNNIQTTTTDAQGNYSFTVPAPGTYTVSEVLQSGWTQTAPSSGTYVVTTSGSQVVNNRDFGNKKTDPPSDCVTPPPGMVGWWPMDDPTGDTVINDIAGIPDNGAPKPGPAVGPTSPSSVAAVVGTGLNFLPSISPTGPEHYVEVPTSSETNFGTGDFTIDAWIKLAQTANMHPIVEKLDFSTPGVNKGYWFFEQGGQLLLRLGPDASGGLVASVSTGPMITPGTWHHVAVRVRRNDVSNKPVITFYINGVFAGSSTPAGPLLPASTSIDGNLSLLIGGKSRAQGGGAITSMAEIAIDELEFFKRELSQTEIQSIFNAKSAGKCKCLAATNEKISCNPNGTFTYQVTVTNLSNSSVSNLVISPNTSNVTITPASITIPPLAPGSSTNVTVTIGGPGAVSGANICFFVGLTGGDGVAGCRVQRCIKLPACHKAGSLTVTKKVKNLLPFPFPPVTNFPITVSCLPSGPNVTINLTDGNAQTLNNIPVGSTCTATEGTLPPPIAHPACASVGWGTPTYSPGQTVTIPSTAGSQTVTVINTYSCNSTSSCATPPPGMVGWWPLDEPNGATLVNDIAGFNNQGAPKPGGQLGTSGPSSVTGEVLGALFFAGPYLEVLPQAELGFGRSDFSIDAWVKPVDCSHGGGGVRSTIVDNFNGTSGFSFYLDQPTVGVANVYLNMNGSTFASIGTIPTLGSSTWSHVAVTVARPSSGPAVGTFYIDGLAAGTFTPPAGSVTNPLPIWIGKTRIPSGTCETTIDELEVFNRVLAPPEVKSIFSAGPAGKCRTGSLVVTKKISNESPFDPPPKTGFPTRVACLPSGPNVKFDLSAGAPTQTVNNIPVGSTCTVTEGPLPDPASSPVCASLHWATPTYSPNQSVVIPNSGASQTVTIQNHFFCDSKTPTGDFTFTPGMNEFCFWGSGGPYNSPRPIDNPNLNSTLVGNTDGSRFGAFSLCYGRILYANDAIAFKYTFNATPAAVLSYPDVNPVFAGPGFPVPVSSTRRNVFGSGLSPIGFQLYFRPQSRIKPFVSTSAGFLFFQDPIPRLNGARFNFSYDVGAGVQVFRDANRAFTLGYKYQRISNGGRALNNPGFNGNIFSFGYSIFKTSGTTQSPRPECENIIINPPELPSGNTATLYNQTLMDTSDCLPQTFSVIGETLPPGLTLSPNGTLSGTPTADGNFAFTVRVTNGCGCTSERRYRLIISPCISCNSVDLFSVGAVNLPPNEASRYNYFAKLKSTSSIRAATLLAEPAPSKMLRLNLSPDDVYDVVMEKVARRDDGSYTWTGTIQGHTSNVILVVQGNQITGWVWVSHPQDERYFSITSLGGGIHVIRKTDQAWFDSISPGCTTGMTTPTGGSPLTVDPNNPANNRRTLSGTVTPQTAVPQRPMPKAGASDCTIDVLVVYTQAAQNAHGNIPNLAQLAVNQANRTYANSKVTGLALNLIGTRDVNYVESGTKTLVGNKPFPTDLVRLQNPSDGFIDQVHTTRDSLQADFVVFIVNDLEATTNLWGHSFATKAATDTAFAVVDWEGATDNLAFAHELGHLQGARHDNDSSTEPFEYGHGSCRKWPYNYRTIMATVDCDETRAPHWSNPDVNYKGRETGDKKIRNNAKVLRDTACTMASLMGPPQTDSGEQYPGKCPWPHKELSGLINGLTTCLSKPDTTIQRHNCSDGDHWLWSPKICVVEEKEHYVRVRKVVDDFCPDLTNKLEGQNNLGRIVCRSKVDPGIQRHNCSEKGKLIWNSPWGDYCLMETSSWYVNVKNLKEDICPGLREKVGKSSGYIMCKNIPSVPIKKKKCSSFSQDGKYCLTEFNDSYWYKVRKVN